MLYDDFDFDFHAATVVSDSSPPRILLLRSAEVPRKAARCPSVLARLQIGSNGTFNGITFIGIHGTGTHCGLGRESAVGERVRG
jgi:hypothetical protein